MSRFVVAFLLAACAALSASVPAAAFEGRLLRPDGSAAAGYQVSLVGTSIAVPTDAQGHFRLLPTPNLPFELVASGPDGELSAPLAVAALPADGALELRLDPAFADSVTVAAGVSPNTEAPPAAARLVLGEAELEQRRPQRLFETLDGIAGASRTDETATGVPALRGLPRGRTLVLLDGARVTTERRAGPSASFLDPFTLASVEVVRGPGSFAYGSDAFGGVIHARSRQPEPGRAGLRFHANQGFGGDDESSAGVEGQLDVLGGALLAQLYYRKADQAEAGGGEKIPDSFYQDEGGALRYARPTRLGRLTAGFSFADSYDTGKPASDSADNRTLYPHESSRRLHLALDLGPTGGWETADLALFLGTYQLVLDRDRLTAVPRIRERSDVSSWDGSLRAAGSRALWGGRLSTGAEVVSRFGLEALAGVKTFDALGHPVSDVTTRAIDDAERNALGLFASFDRAMGSHAVASLGLRGDSVRSKNSGGFFGDRSTSHGALSGFAALTVGPFHGATATFQAARGFRDPLLSDRYFRGPSGRGFIIGNPDLDPETSLQYDAVLRIPAGKAQVTVYGYRYQIDDLIERYRPVRDFLFRNRGQAVIRGLELEARLPLPAGLTLDLALARARGEVTDDGTPLPDIAPDGGSATLRWAGARGYAYFRGAAFASDDRPGVAEVARPGYSTFDAGVGYDIGHGIELRLLGRNLTDRRYRDSADEVASLARGRNFTVGFVGKL